MRHHIISFSILVLLFGLVTMFNACGIQKPRVEVRSLASVSFLHTGFEATCNGCHENKRPLPVGNVPHGDGGDCSSCHITSGWLVGVAFNHNPVPNACNSCHEKDRPVLTAAGQPHNSIGECKTCHGVTAWLPTTSFDHKPPVPACATCHKDTPAGIIKQMNHAFAGLPDCGACHQANLGVSWAGGVFSHSPTPASCIECHVGERPNGPVGTPPFDHAVGGMGDCKSCHNTNVGVSWNSGKFEHTSALTNCATCHKSQMPTTVINKMNHTHPGIPDCSSCHMANLGVNWTGGTFSHSPAPISCQDCHTSERPIGPVGSSAYDHNNGGMGDCKSCHTTNLGTSWAGGQFSHSPMPANCISCHTKAPTGVLPDTRKGFDHASIYGNECKTCHTNISANVGNTWAGGYFNHNNNNATSFTNCAPCHSTYKSQSAHGAKCGGNMYCSNKNCSECHTIVWPKPSSSTPGYTSGKFD